MKSINYLSSIIRSILIIGIIFCLSNSTHAIKFNRLGIQEGLSQISVTTLCQDTLGRIWIGTRDGLNVYNGSSIRTFRPIKNDNTSLLGYSVTQLVKDKHTLWVGTKSGISKLDLTTLQFEQFECPDVLSLALLKNKLIVGTSHGLYTLNEEKKILEKAMSITTRSDKILTLHLNKENELFLGTSAGLFLHNATTTTCKKLLNYTCSAFYTDSTGKLWVGTQNNGVILLDKQYKELRHFVNNTNEPSLVSNRVRDIAEDSKGRIWIGTFLGLSVIDPKENSIENYNHQENNDKSLTHNSVYSVMKDNQGNMWIGTYFGGLCFVDNDIDLFKSYKIDEKGMENGLSYGVVGKMVEDKKGNIWIATEGGGLNYYNKATGAFKQYKAGINGCKLSCNNIRDLKIINDKTLYIGTHTGGLNIYDLHKQTFSSYKQSDYPTVDAILDYKHSILLGTKQGLIVYDSENNKFSNFFENERDRKCINSSILALYEDSKGILWIGTEKKGIFSYHPSTGKLRHYETSIEKDNCVPVNTISCIYEDHLFRLWIGTHGGGIYRYNREQDNFSVYNRSSHRLSSDFVQGIQESRFGSLWVSCSKGLTRFDTYKDKMYNYTYNCGLSLNELNQGSLLLTNEGEIFVGGVDGLISFYEEALLNRPNHFQLYFNAISINNQRIDVGKSNVTLTEDLPFANKLELEANQNSFLINFATDNYITINKNTFKYKLEGYDNDWVDNGYKNEVTYTNLPTGEYTLKIRGISGVEEEIIATKELAIVVHPVFYKSPLACVIYLLVLSILFLYLYYSLKNNFQLVQKIKIEQREKERIEELNRSKIDFFTNLSHEFRTPLSLISGNLEVILDEKRTNSSIQKRIKNAYANTLRLNHLISELLDFRKLEYGKTKLSIQEYSLNIFLIEIVQSFSEFADRKKAQLSLNVLKTDKNIGFDRTQMEKVLFNLLSNAFKFMNQDHGQVNIGAEEEADYLKIWVEDNGEGIPETLHRAIFDTYYQIENSHKHHFQRSTGIGLSLCKSIVELHKGNIAVSNTKMGTRFIVRLPKQFETSEAPITVDVKSKKLVVKPDVTDELQQKTTNKTADKSLTLLIVEDNIDVQNLIADTFANDYNIILANDGQEGLEMAINNVPHIIVSDVMMPGLHGTEMCKILKRNEKTSHIPIVLLTARASNEFRIEGLKIGADAYISKPFSTRYLKTQIENLLINRKKIIDKLRADIETKKISDNSVTTESNFVRKALSLIEENLDNLDFDVETFAQQMGVGRTKLFSRIKKETDQTPNEMITSVRLEKAALMLKHKPDYLSIAEIAYAVGFSTPRYFSKCFRNYYGVTPTEYIAQS